MATRAKRGGTAMSEVRAGAKTQTTARTGSPIIEAHDLTKFYGEVLGLNGVELAINPGITGLLGPNGAGKSTLLWTIAGQLRPSRGTCTVYGERVPGGAGLRAKMGLCPEADAFYWEMSGTGFVEAMGRLSGLDARLARKRAGEVMEEMGLSAMGARAVRTYSRGERGRLKLAQALVAEPQLLLLDEPLAGADPVGRSEVIGLVRRLAARGKDVIVSSHVLEEVEAFTDTVVMMFRGRVIAEGRIEAIRELLDKHPHQVVIVCAEPGRLARALMESADVVSCRTVNGTLEVETRKPADFYTRLPKILAAGKHEVKEIRAGDDSLEAVFRYLTEK